MATGVRLACGLPGAPVGRHVHLAHEDWAITSDVAPDDPAMLDALLDVALPGAVGCYVYPRDAVLHLPAARATGAADLQRVLQRHGRRERAPVGPRRLNQRTVALATDADEEEEEGEEEGEEEDDGASSDEDAAAVADAAAADEEDDKGDAPAAEEEAAG